MPGTTLAPTHRWRHAFERARAPLTRDLSIAFRRFGRFSGAAVALFGIAVVIGWASGSAPLTQLHPGWPAVQPNLALGLTLLGTALFALSDEQAGSRARGLARALAAVAVFFGLATLVEYLYA